MIPEIRPIWLILGYGSVYKEVAENKDEEIKLLKQEIEELKKGVLLEDGKTLPAKVSGIKYDKNKTSMYISIREGRNRQIRRMIEKFGYKVLMLRREKIGELSLGDLKEGKYRELTKEEIEYLYSV